MGRIGFYIRLYVLIISRYIRARMQYRADFWISNIGMLFMNLAAVFTYWIMFHSVNSIQEWNYWELLFIYFYSLLALLPMQLLFENLWNIRYYIVNGSFIKYYFRPLNMLFYYVSEMFDLKGIAQVVVGVAGLVVASLHLAIPWNPAKIVLLLVTLFSSSLVMVSVMLAAASTAFWIMNPTSVLMFTYKITNFTRYPVTVFNSAFRFVFTFLIPVGFVAFYPSQLFLRPLTHVPPVVYASPVVGIVLFLLAYRVWKLGVNSYTGTGS